MIPMTRFGTLPILPSTVVGSHGKGSWWYAGVREHEKGVWGEGDLAEKLDDAADTAIRDMTKAGVGVITDAGNPGTRGHWHLPLCTEPGALMDAPSRPRQW